MSAVTIKEVEKYWSDRPCNIRHSKKEIGTLEYFEEVEQRKFLVEQHIAPFLQFNKYRGKNVLDVGTGIGTIAIMFSKSGAHITGVELSKTSFDICKKRYEVYGFDSELYNIDAERMRFYWTNNVNYKKKVYDLVFSFGVIHHSPNPDKIMREIYHISHPETEIKIMVYSKWSWKGLTFFAQHGWKFGWNYSRCIQYFAEAQTNCPIAKTYTKRTLRELCKDFEIVSMEKAHIFPYKIKDYIQHKYNKVWIFKIMPDRLFRHLEKKLGWHWLVTLKKKK